MEIAQVSVNKTCCVIINRLLISLNCLSSPVNDLTELHDGCALVEIIESFESAYGLCTKHDSNYSFIKKWLTKQGVFLGRNRTVDEILKGGQIFHLAMLCYAITTVFLKHDKFLRRRIPNYNFQVNDKDMVEIVLYTKWKLCEEEVDLKSNEISILRHEISTVYNENSLLKNEISDLNNKVKDLKNDIKKKDEEYKITVARLIAELSHEKYKQMEASNEITF